ncbi:MAG: hypothetical protein Q7N50_00920 [Armatimonadota bacterium]|nr:hypothetical protein [Armatimonadota bacterium]
MKTKDIKSNNGKWEPAGIGLGIDAGGRIFLERRVIATATGGVFGRKVSELPTT